MIVVTGAAGHVGNNLVRALLTGARSEQVRCMVLPGESLRPLEGLPVEIVEGDVRSPDSLKRAFQGADVVYHLASVIALLPSQYALLEEVNVRGARNVAETCLRCGVRRLVYTSSIHAIAEPPRGVMIDESMPIDPDRTRMLYSKSKARGTLEVLDVAKRGLDAVVICPTGVIGPFDHRPSEMGQLFLDYAAGKMPAYIEGAYDFVDVRDVALGHVSAAEKGKKGELYILSGELVTVRWLMDTLSVLTGVPAPRLRLPVAAASMAAAVSTAWSRLTGRRPLLNKDSLYTLGSNSYVTSGKAKEKLGFAARPVRESIADTLQWFRDEGMLKPGR